MRVDDMALKANGGSSPTGGVFVPNVATRVPALPFDGARAEVARVLPIWQVLYLPELELQDGQVVKLKQQLKVDVESGTDTPIVVFAPALGMGGVGNDIVSALVDLSCTIYSLWEEYSNTPAQELAPSAKRLLRRLSRLWAVE
jgi:hypothetical protein